jgi:YHS domain-containing protein
MDSEIITSLVSILILGAAFVLMVRFGCGAHILGGHGHHGSQRGDNDAGAGESTKDPVCGRGVDQTKAAASVYGGRMYYFCSVSCRNKFEKAPERYASAVAESPAAHGGHQHG